MKKIKWTKRKTGRGLLVGVAAFTAAGGFLADWNKTHLFNPRWPPHARFHDAMTILLAALLGGSSLYLLQQPDAHRPRPLLWATLLPGFFWTAMAGSYAFPGAKGLKAEFPEKVKRAGGLTLGEGAASALMLSLLALGYGLARKGK
jgi:hypothetical protein